jgi:hypothetical protein
MRSVERIEIKEFRCYNCDGMCAGEPVAFVNGVGWCKGCVMRLKHWWANFIPPVPNSPLSFLICGYMCVGYAAVIGVGLFALTSSGSS